MFKAASLEDLPGLLALGRACHLSWDEAHLRAQLTAQTSLLVVAVIEQGVAGALSAQRIVDEAELFDLGVLPEFRQRGLAYELVQHLFAWAGGAGCRRLCLEVARDNGPARALYAKLGFTQQGLRPGYYPRAQGLAVDALVLVRYM